MKDSSITLQSSFLDSFQWGNARVCSWNSYDPLSPNRVRGMRLPFRRYALRVYRRTKCQFRKPSYICFASPSLVVDCESFCRFQLPDCDLNTGFLYTGLFGDVTVVGGPLRSISNWIPSFANNANCHCFVLFLPRKKRCDDCFFQEVVDMQGSFSWLSSWLRHVILLSEPQLTTACLNWATAVRLTNFLNWIIISLSELAFRDYILPWAWTWKAID